MSLILLFSTDESLLAKFSNIAFEIERKYPGHVLPEEVREWLFMNAGGWMGSVHILHASVAEYVLFFGTAVDTQGHSGTTVHTTNSLQGGHLCFGTISNCLPGL